MTGVLIVTVLLSLGSAWADVSDAPGQSPAAQAPPAQAPAPSSARTVSLDSQLLSNYRAIRRSFAAAAERMPPTAYAFRPAPAMRTFGEAVEHAARTAGNMCARILGRPVSDGGDGAAKSPALSKAQVMVLVDESFAVCDQYAATLKPDTLGETFETVATGPDGGRVPLRVARAGMFVNLIAHTNEMYGYLAVYLRLKGVVPPTSDPPAGGRGGDGRGSTGPSDQALPPAQVELVNAERAFAKLAVERGVRESFLTYFADAGVGFAPYPYTVKDSLKNSPAPGARSPVVLNWAPIAGDIAEAGDLGWNTGPTVFEDTSPAGTPTRHGMFFSVWKKQSDGQWRVVLDLGADTPAAVAPLTAPFKTAYRAASRPAAGSVNVEDAIAGLLAAEREFLAAAKAASLGQAYQARLSDDARIHRPGAMPVVGREALRGWVTRQTMALDGEPIDADVSRSGDLGYAYGRYDLGGATPEQGYYARVWKRDAAGQWRIVMDTVNPVPPGTPPPSPPPTTPPSPLAQKAQAHYQAQQWAEAAAAYQQHVKENPKDPVGWHRLGTSQIYLKQYASAIASLRQAIAAGGTGALDFYNLGCAYALSGQKDLALDSLEKAINAGFTNRQQYETDTDLDSLRQTDRFKELLKRLR